ncbi:MAG: hypothetical protein NTY65_12340 [Planctomycetota bacterium]|nr:hypothetical protein [Planctomycetota bacterium]
MKATALIRQRNFAICAGVPIRVARRRVRGNALLEFLLTIPIIVFVAGLTIYMSIAMLTKQQAIKEARATLWHDAQGGWSPMKLEGRDPTYPDPGVGGKHMPRGYGEDLDRLRPDLQRKGVPHVNGPEASNYWLRIWDNLPARHETESTKTFQTAPMWNFLATSADASHRRDSSPWYFDHLDAWRIARAGPLAELFGIFRLEFENSSGLNQFESTRKEFFRRLFHAGDIVNQNQGG